MLSPSKMSKISTLLTYLGCLLFLFACSNSNQYFYRDNNATKPKDFSSNLFVPENNRVRLSIGQDKANIHAYVNEVDGTPKGVVGYTSIPNLDGLLEDADQGNEINNIRALSKDFPDSDLIVGLYLVGALENIVAGRYDQEIIRLLNVISKHPSPVFLRWGYEADGPWNQYEPELYKKSWQRLHNILLAQGLEKKIALVWQLSAWCGGTFEQHPFTDWWPGKDYVNWIGFSYFSQHNCDYSTIKQILSFAREQNLPVFINESTPRGFDVKKLIYSPKVNGPLQFKPISSQQIWSSWYQGFFETIKGNRDIIRAVTYINANWDAQHNFGPPYAAGYWGNSRVQDNELIKQRWLEEIDKDYWE